MWNRTTVAGIAAWHAVVAAVKHLIPTARADRRTNCPAFARLPVSNRCVCPRFSDRDPATKILITEARMSPKSFEDNSVRPRRAVGRQHSTVCVVPRHSARKHWPSTGALDIRAKFRTRIFRKIRIFRDCLNLRADWDGSWATGSRGGEYSGRQRSAGPQSARSCGPPITTVSLPMPDKCIFVL